MGYQEKREERKYHQLTLSSAIGIKRPSKMVIGHVRKGQDPGASPSTAGGVGSENTPGEGIPKEEHISQVQEARLTPKDIIERENRKKKQQVWPASFRTRWDLGKELETEKNDKSDRPLIM